MSALVRVFTHTSVTSAALNPGAGRYTTDSVSMLKMPYVAREAVTVSSGAATSTTTALTTNASVKLFHVQIQPGKVVAIEVNPPNRSVPADAESPYYSGDITIEAGKDWTLSIIEIEVA